MSILLAILILGIIILIHEFGHFICAKFFKVPVREFSIGMGPRIFSKVFKNTRYSFKVFPFGGSCAMIGEDSAGSGDFTNVEGVNILEDGVIDFEGVRFTKEEIEKNNFSVIAPYKKLLICLSGPFANFFTAIICAFVIVLNMGFDIPIISNVSENSPAINAYPTAVLPNDKIIMMETTGVKDKIICYRDVLLFMQLNNDSLVKNKLPIILTLERYNENNQMEIVETIVAPKIEDGRAIMGLTFENLYKKPNSFFEIIKYTFNEFYFYINTTIKSLKMLVTGKLNTADISGPIGTVAIMSDVIDEAQSINIQTVILNALMLILLISANLGVMNLLPIPALDGGRVIFAIIEMIIRKPINQKIEGVINGVTMILLLLFMVWIFGLDIYKLFTGALY